MCSLPVDTENAKPGRTFRGRAEEEKCPPPKKKKKEERKNKPEMVER